MTDQRFDSARMSANESGPSADTADAQYTVVARRYRPQSFGDMVGQNHIAQALTNAISQNRVGHAYLFTGARGVGKTSSARIFAKCLNCVQGPSGKPCNECDVCTSVSTGEDIDVLEIDGASNRGIDEIRQLRSNAIVRPSRARFKIYIIDEVHMLTQQAFNALLKTLEEPPDHVKFIFCTTDPQKIPITVLSRCQRFDFSPVQTPEIIKRLQEICTTEEIEIDEPALAILARRAAGSMRDSQSLLEQLLSFCVDKISIEDVHRLLGTADTRRIGEIVQSMVDKQTAECVNGVAEAIQSGVDAGQLATQLLGYFRDIMAIRVGASPETLLTVSEADVDSIKQQAEQLGLETTLSIVQVLDRCITRMQASLHGRTLLEVAVIRICNLEYLNLIADLVDQVGSAPTSSRPSPTAPSKKNDPAETVATVAGSESHPVNDAVDSPAVANTTTAAVATAAPVAASVAIAASAAAATTEPATKQPEPADVASSADDSAGSTDSTSQPATATTKLTDANVTSVWKQTANDAGGMISDAASQFKDVKLSGNRVVVRFNQKHLFEFCNRTDRKQALAAVLEKIVGGTVGLEFLMDEVSLRADKPKTPKLTRVQRIRQLEKNDFVKNAIEVFDAEVVDFHDPPTDR